MSSDLANIQHPLEGIFYLFLIATFVRWKWPKFWNKILETVEAKPGNNKF